MIKTYFVKVSYDNPLVDAHRYHSNLTVKIDLVKANRGRLGIGDAVQIAAGPMYRNAIDFCIDFMIEIPEDENV